MAFATANIKTGSVGSLKFTCGDWTGSAGDANGTLALQGGRVYLCEFSSQDSANGPTQTLECFVSSTSGQTITISVPNRQTVVIGRFFIVSA